MALTNLDKDNLNRLFEMINLRDKNNIIDVKTNYSTYSKLEIIGRQIMNLKIEAEKILENHNINEELKNVECNFKKFREHIIIYIQLIIKSNITYSRYRMGYL